MRLTQALTLAMAVATPTMALPKDPILDARDNVNCYDTGMGWVGDARGEARSVCKPMSGHYQPNQHIKHCRGNGPLGHINFEIQRTADDAWEMSYDSCVGYFTKIINRCEAGGEDRDRDRHWWLKADPQVGNC